MRVASFNANSIRARLDVILAWLKTMNPDILCIQETKATDADFPAEAIRSAGYNVVFRGEKSYNGVAIISRREATGVSFGLDSAVNRDETRLVCAKFGSIHVVNTYVPQGREIDNPMYAYKIEWLGRLRKFFEQRFSVSDKVVWLGDMNVAPEAIDIHNAAEQANHVCFHHAVRNAFAETVSWGFTDVFRKHHPEPGQYSFFDYRALNAVKRNMGWRVDHILCAPPLARLSVDSFIDLEPRMKPKASDHTFVVADFKGEPDR
jgi:exodeoxyribonuclease-3